MGKVTSGGGRPRERDVRKYQPPQGPLNINDPQGPGLHGDRCGNTLTGIKRVQSSARECGDPGLGGDKPRRYGSQR